MSIFQQLTVCTAVRFNLVSQGSVAKRLRCDGTFNYRFVWNLLLSLTGKGLSKSVSTWQS